MTEPAEGPKPSDEPDVVVAMVLPTFNAPGDIVAPDARESAAVKTSMNLQTLGSQSTWHEIRGSIAGVERGRIAELMGLAGAAGEQLGLATTASRDVGRWLAVDTDRNEGWSFATRAATERLVGYLHSASHHFGNVALRTMLLKSGAGGPLQKKAATYAEEHPDAAPLWKPYSTNVASYISLNRESAKMLRKEGRAHEAQAYSDVADAVTSITADDRWERMTARRNAEYHRWRIQSAPGADAAEDPWVIDEGTASVSLTVYAPGRVPFDSATTVKNAEDARGCLALLGTAMQAWLEIWEERSDELTGG